MNRLSKLFATLLLSGCGPMLTVVDAGAPVDAGADGGADAGALLMPRCSQPTAVTCQDQSIQRLALRQVVATGVINEEGTRPGEKTYLDGRGGGLMTPESYLYARFTSQGLEKVEVNDEAALTSMDWDIAFRRFIIRLNAGVSGPSCVVGARTAAGTTFDALTAVPANLSWRTEAYFTGATCEFVADPSGIGGPNAALTSYWSYQSCVQMTGNVYVLHLRDGRHVKFEVLSYYEPTAQQVCNRTGSAPSPSGAASFRVRWAYLDATP